MKDYIIYNSSSGKILRTGRCQDNIYHSMELIGDEDIMEGEANGREQYVSLAGGAPTICNKTDEQIEAERNAWLLIGDNQ